MASNSEFQDVGTLGWRQGFDNLFRKENYLWWRTSRWWVQFLIWLAIANGILYMVIGIAPKMRSAAGSGSDAGIAASNGPSSEETTGPLDIYGLTVFLKMAGITIALGVVVLAQGSMIDEKQAGTAAWVLSKPVSRAAFILSKVMAHTIGVLAVMVAAQGGVAYLLIYLITGSTLPVLPFIGAMGLLFVGLLFWLTLTIMLSTLSNLRGLVIGIPLILILGFSLFVEILPWVSNYMPWTLTTAISAARPAMAVALVTAQPMATWMPLFASLAWCLIFTGVAIWRFGKDEF